MHSGGICGGILRNHWWEIEADYLSKKIKGKEAASKKHVFDVSTVDIINTCNFSTPIPITMSHTDADHSPLVKENSHYYPGYTKHNICLHVPM